jgi:broad specificity phosphatase PhoE
MEVFRRTWAEIDFCPNGGESCAMTHARTLAALDDIAARHPDETAVAATHGGVISCLLRSLDDAMSMDDAFAIRMPAVYVLAQHDGTWSVVDREQSCPLPTRRRLGSMS